MHECRRLPGGVLPDVQEQPVLGLALMDHIGACHGLPGLRLLPPQVACALTAGRHALAAVVSCQPSGALSCPPCAGPTSTQMGFALGVLKKGLSGGLLSGALFQVRLLAAEALVWGSTAAALCC